IQQTWLRWCRRGNRVPVKQIPSSHSCPCCASTATPSSLQPQLQSSRCLCRMSCPCPLPDRRAFLPIVRRGHWQAQLVLSAEGSSVVQSLLQLPHFARGPRHYSPCLLFHLGISCPRYRLNKSPRLSLLLGYSTHPSHSFGYMDA